MSNSLSTLLHNIVFPVNYYNQPTEKNEAKLNREGDFTSDERLFLASSLLFLWIVDLLLFFFSFSFSLDVDMNIIDFLLPIVV